MAGSRVVRSLATLAGLLHETTAVSVGRQAATRNEGIPWKAIHDAIWTTPAPPFGCRKPKEGEKIIYMVVHAEDDETNDGALTAEGKEEAEDLRTDPRFELAFSNDPKYRAQAIITAPTRKCMQTAMIAFKDKLPEATWVVDPDIKGKGRANDAIWQLGVPLLEQYNASESMISMYRQDFDHEHMGTHADRFTRFVSNLFNRTEQNIIVVATDYESHLAGAELGYAEVRVLALTPNKEDSDRHGWGAFRMLSKPSRWPKCLDTPTGE